MNLGAGKGKRSYKMDFAALMAQQIAKAKGTTSTPSKSPTQDAKPATTAPKFISRREAEEQRKAAYIAEQKALEAERAARAAAKRKREDEATSEAKAREEKRQRLAEESRIRREAKEAEEERARRKRLGLPELPPKNADAAADAAEAEIKRRRRTTKNEQAILEALFAEVRRAYTCSTACEGSLTVLL